MSLADFILKTLDDNSGGIKFTALLVEVICAIKEEKISGVGFYFPESIPEVIETHIRHSMEHTVGILDYAWKMTGDFDRHKMFVFTKN